MVTSLRLRLIHEPLTLAARSARKCRRSSKHCNDMEKLNQNFVNSRGVHTSRGRGSNCGNTIQPLDGDKVDPEAEVNCPQFLRGSAMPQSLGHIVRECLRIGTRSENTSKVQWRVCCNIFGSCAQSVDSAKPILYEIQ